MPRTPRRPCRFPGCPNLCDSGVYCREHRQYSTDRVRGNADSTYNSLLESGWRMQEIDGMDMPGFLRIRAWNAKREKKKKEPRRAYIDEVWANLKP